VGVVGWRVRSGVPRVRRLVVPDGRAAVGRLVSPPDPVVGRRPVCRRGLVEPVEEGHPVGTILVVRVVDDVPRDRVVRPTDGIVVDGCRVRRRRLCHGIVSGVRVARTGRPGAVVERRGVGVVVERWRFGAVVEGVEFVVLAAGRRDVGCGLHVDQRVRDVDVLEVAVVGPQFVFGSRQDLRTHLQNPLAGGWSGHHLLLFGVDVDLHRLHLPEVLQAAFEFVSRHQREDGRLVVDERLQRRRHLGVGVEPAVDQVREHDPAFEQLLVELRVSPPAVELDVL